MNKSVESRMTSNELAVLILERLSRSRLRRSVFASGARWSVSLIFMAVAFPVMLDRLGQAGFGRWAVLTTPTSLAGAFDIGVLPAVVALAGPIVGRLSSTNSRDSRDELLSQYRSYVISGVLISMAAFVLILGLGLTSSESLARAVIPGAVTSDDLFLFRASILNLALTVLAAGLLAPLEACGRVDLTSAVWGLLSVMNSVGIVVALLIAPTLRSLGIVVAAVGLATLSAAILVLWHTGLCRALWTASGLTLRVPAVLRLGISMGGSGAVGAMVDPVIKWVATPLVGLPGIASYELSVRIANTAGGFFRALAYPLASHYARSIGDTEVRKSASAAVNRMGEHLAAVALPTLGLVAVLGPILSAYWLRSSVPPGFSLSLLIVTSGSMTSFLAVPAYLGLVGSGNSRSVLTVQLVTISGAVTMAVVLGRVLPDSVYLPGLSLAFSMTLGAYFTLRSWGHATNTTSLKLLCAHWRGLLGAWTVLAVGLPLMWIHLPLLLELTVVVCVFIAAMLVAHGKHAAILAGGVMRRLLTGRR